MGKDIRLVAVTAVGVIVAGLILQYFGTMPILSDAKKGIS